MKDLNNEAVDIARNYYNSEDADAFYSTVWGGEDIHIGLYNSDDDTIYDASRRTQDRMIEHLDRFDESTRIIDMGSGYGGAARYLAGRFGCSVVALNLSEVENDRARILNREQGLDHLIDVVDGNFESIPYDDESFDVVWSQDAFLHSPAREQVIMEAARILKPGGEFVITDPMQSDDCPEGVLEPILNRIHLENMASPGFYRKTASEYGLDEVDFDELTVHLKRHYSTVLRETEKHEDELKEKVTAQYLENMKKGLKHWVDGAENGYLSWGILHFRKR
ncbi:MAG: methyltransferase domain-containing protein [Balneolaceae bacterium]